MKQDDGGTPIGEVTLPTLEADGGNTQFVEGPWHRSGAVKESPPIMNILAPSGASISSATRSLRGPWSRQDIDDNKSNPRR